MPAKKTAKKGKSRKPAKKKTGKRGKKKPTPARKIKRKPPKKRKRKTVGKPMVSLDKFTKREKLQVVRDLMAGDPNCLDYGYLLIIQKHFRRKYRMDVDYSYISKLRTEIIAEWARTKIAEHSKGHLLSVWSKLFNKLKNENSKIRILTEIGKLNGHYIEKHEVATPDIEAAGKRLEELFKEAHANTTDKG